LIAPKPAEWEPISARWIAPPALGVFAWIGLPPVDAPFVGWLSLVGLFFFLGKTRRYQNARNGAWIFFLFGLGYHWACLTWLHELTRFNAFAPIGVLLVGVAMSLYLLPVGMALGATARQVPTALPIVGALAWMLSDWARSVGVLAFSFFPVGQFLWCWPKTITPLGWELTTATVVGTAALVGCAMNRWWAVAGFEGHREGRHLASVAAVVAVLVLLCASGSSMWKIDKESLSTSPRTVRIGLFQPNIAQWRKIDAWASEEVSLGVVTDTLELLKRHEADKLDLIVLPEATFPGFAGGVLFQPQVQKLAMSIAWRHQAEVIFSDTHFVPRFPGAERDVDHDVFNTSWLLSPDDRMFPSDRRYHKRRLVPYGEHMPLLDALFPWLNDMMFGIGIFAQGTWNQRPWDVEGVGRVGVLICFESSSAEVVENSVRMGAQLLAVPTNDSWFGESAGLEHHWRHAIARAYEFGVPVVQAANTGVTGLVDPWSDRIERIPSWTPDALIASIDVPTWEESPMLSGRRFRLPALLALMLAVGIAWITRPTKLN